MTTLFTRLRGALNRVLPGRLYTAYTLSSTEHVATTDLTVRNLRELLRMGGYERQRLSAAKKHPETGQLHDLSMRRVPDRHPDAAHGTDLAIWPAEKCQYHVHAFDMGDTTWVASHYELKPDLWPPSITRLKHHYRPEYGETYLRGVTDIDGADFHTTE